MNDFIAARSQMALSLGFHIIFSCIGMVMPFFMAVAHYYYLKTGQIVYKNVTKAWSKGVAIFFATGAVSGTVLSFELGLLWPEFMKHAGPIFGMPFSLEGTAFFIEAIALGFFLYGWDRFNPWFHWFTGVVVGVSGLASGILVVAANAWMNSPAGFEHLNGQYLNIDPIAAMFNEAWFSQALHMTIAAFAATGFAVAGVHALMILRGNNVLFHTKSFTIAAVFGCAAALVQPLSGDISAKDVAIRQPAKLAAMEAHFHTEKSASLIVGGIPNETEKKVDFAIKLPGFLSFLAHGDFTAEVTGLDRIPEENHPPVAVTHYAFQIMVGMGMAMMLVSVLYFTALWKKRKWLQEPWLLKLFAIATPLGFIAVEAGWTVTEVGRQPWIIYGIMRTADAVTPMPGIAYSFYLFTAIYASLAAFVVFMLYRQIKMVGELYDV
ncbi:cytochrome d ubiquinol oxidase subunit I [Dyadobacter sp. BE34]|uniref:Cytochrome d ubiquinol oxidase subunit I n=1 Tax=Dyadobacter fermentans TaxID=94254 RepID=A0ABU1R6F7_9BACT|nr:MULTISPECIES: cytochrome ubiquinol oxidase subunit I [Dyadobacter]MDR6808992.1 cytochrome d ubiquinol oxidase subunit I [Dyadobacter fermentans]MDR7046735.1 cytochrome d ubiquinol oxidase subunit I [Dyadobacter sp. BE242]MDR7201049.1 cytochrome d ubiquinol oxidase subunit I [Dyadobacter sp. BE34]MDR7219009.1 cytochrome d ubiquinol oxidase subunit I [Dyadobacter sp. BE31]MDR7264781.1 cytochrome d ubiquinol oxidase subunit I [Dyadobacter sp. BE32]